MYLIEGKLPEELTVDLPTSKSLTHRTLILGSLNCGPTKIINPLKAEDTEITTKALNSLGSNWKVVDNGVDNSKPISNSSGEDIYLGNSGSSARFLLPLASYCDKPVKYYGTERMHQRPVGELLEALMMLGAKFEANNDALPVTVYPSQLQGGSISFPSLPSSQVVTSLMLAALWMENDLSIQLPDYTPSLPYIQMTVNLMQKLGCQVQYKSKEIDVMSIKPLKNWELKIEKDMSAASYWVVFALINGIKVTLEGVTLPSLQGDERIFEIAELAGSKVMLYNDKAVIEGSITKAFDVDCMDIPDLVPAVAVLAMFAPDTVTISNIKHLEYKESNRVQAIQDNLAKLGGKSEYTGGSLIIYPQKKYHSGIINSYNDHRIAMSFAIAGSKVDGVSVSNPECVNKSYPKFWNDFTWWKKVSEEV